MSFLMTQNKSTINYDYDNWFVQLLEGDEKVPSTPPLEGDEEEGK